MLILWLLERVNVIASVNCRAQCLAHKYSFKIRCYFYLSHYSHGRCPGNGFWKSRKVFCGGEHRRKWICNIKRWGRGNNLWTRNEHTHRKPANGVMGLSQGACEQVSCRGRRVMSFSYLWKFKYHTQNMEGKKKKNYYKWNTSKQCGASYQIRAQRTVVFKNDSYDLLTFEK